MCDHQKFQPLQKKTYHNRGNIIQMRTLSCSQCRGSGSSIGSEPFLPRIWNFFSTEFSSIYQPETVVIDNGRIKNQPCCRTRNTLITHIRIQDKKNVPRAPYKMFSHMWLKILPYLIIPPTYKFKNVSLHTELCIYCI